MKGFRDFLLRDNVVNLAVAVVMGAVFGNVVSALVRDLITPLFAAAGGQPDFSAIAFTINGSKFMIGDFINSFISLLFTAVVVYFLLVLPANKVREGTDKKVKEETTRDCPFCTSKISKAATRCPFCTSEVEKIA